MQLSAEIFQIVHSDENIIPTVICHWDTFNKFISPSQNAFWVPNATKIHDLHAESPRLNLKFVLLNHALLEEWIELDEHFIPCGCKVSFFCLNSLTERARIIFVQHDNSCTVTKRCTDK